jgi:hypothetical protein
LFLSRKKYFSVLDLSPGISLFMPFSKEIKLDKKMNMAICHSSMEWLWFTSTKHFHFMCYSLKTKDIWKCFYLLWKTNFDFYLEAGIGCLPTKQLVLNKKKKFPLNLFYYTFQSLNGWDCPNMKINTKLLNFWLGWNNEWTLK